MNEQGPTESSGFTGAGGGPVEDADFTPVAPQETARSSTAEERNWAVGAHLVGFTGFLMPFADMIGAFAVMITKGQESDFVRVNARESLNFQISTAIYTVVSAVLCLVGIGFVLLPLVMIFQVVNVIRAAIAASQGETFEYPLCLRLIN